jgi:PIN domain nuclease of toxin-antitoxin system
LFWRAGKKSRPSDAWQEAEEAGCKTTVAGLALLLALDGWIKAEALQAIEQASEEAAVSLSVMTAWELGMLASKGRLRLPTPPLRCFEDVAEAITAAVQPVTSPILVGSSFLPGPIHPDPIDRILITTAREHDLVLVTRDRAILRYGAAGHVRTLAC